MNYLFLALAGAVVLAVLPVVGLLARGRTFGVPSVIGVAGVGFVATAAATIAAVVLGADGFGLIHVWYLILTISVPATAAAALLTKLTTWATVLLVPMLLAAPIGLYATHIEPFWLRVDRQTLTVDDLQTDVRIGVLADLQTTEIGGYERSAVDALLAERPDVVLIPGDVWQMSPVEFEERKGQFAEVMTRIADNVSYAFVVNGNSDSVAGLKEITGDSGVIVLDNEFAEFTFEEQPIVIAGVTLFSDPDAVSNTVDALIDAELGGDALTILLGHKPDEIFGIPPGAEVDLVVAGHTHGGQFRLPLLPPPLTLSKVPRSVGAGGLHDLNGQTIYVSTGVGRERHQAPQMRFGVRPSIGVIDVRS